MTKKNKFQIVINGVPNGSDLARYEFKAQGTNISLSMSKNKAVAEFSLGNDSKYAKELLAEFNFSTQIVQECCSKILCLYAIKYAQGLKIKTVWLAINGNKGKPYDKTLEGFPFIHSMIPESGLGLGENWTENRDFQEKFLNALCEKHGKQDSKIAAVYSYLSSSERNYEIDKFTCLWTAMNAYYNYVAECYRKHQIGKQYTLHGHESNKIVALLKVLDCYNATSLNNKISNSTITTIGDALKEVDIAQIAEKLYDDLQTTPTANQQHNMPYDIIRATAKQYDIKPFGFMLLKIAYQLRCNYFHGNIPTLLVTTIKSREYRLLYTVNHFLDRFLNEHIPNMFDKQFFTDEMARKISQGLQPANNSK